MVINLVWFQLVTLKIYRIPCNSRFSKQLSLYYDSEGTFFSLKDVGSLKQWKDHIITFFCQCNYLF